jgi:hypothetical protein
MNLLDLMNELGSRIRYGVGANDKYKMMMDQTVPGQPQAFLPSGDENPAAVRYLSNYLGAKQWGESPTTLVNQLRYLIDNDATTFGAGIKGARAGADPLKSVLMARMK